MPLPARALAAHGRGDARSDRSASERAARRGRFVVLSDTSTQPSRTALLAAALRRFVLLVVAVAAGTALVSLAIGLLFGAGVSRSISLGFYGVGSFILIMGFFAGNRGPARVKGEPGGGLIRGRATRWASGTEQRESINLSFVFVALGALLIVFGVLADTRYSLF